MIISLRNFLAIFGILLAGIPHQGGADAAHSANSYEKSRAFEVYELQNLTLRELKKQKLQLQDQ
jgi:hypothetical protein